jgi:hypothetical protein
MPTTAETIDHTTLDTFKQADTSVSLKRAHEEAAHDVRFRAEVEQGLAEADDPNTQWISNEDAKKSWAKQRAELVKRAGGTA